MRFITLAAAAALFALQGLADDLVVREVNSGVIESAAATFLTFQCPGGVDTTPVAINVHGVVTGTCGGRGFIRDLEGHFILFNVANLDTFPAGINSHGDVAGYYNIPVPDGRPIPQGFVRFDSGEIKTWDVGAPNIPTFVNGINSQGVIVGAYITETSRPVGFVRNPDGTFQGYGPPFLFNTNIYAINEANQIAGASYDGNDKPHAFFGANGVITPIPGSLFPDLPFPGSIPTGINASGEMAGIAFGFLPDLIAQVFFGTPQMVTLSSPLVPLQSIQARTRSFFGGGLDTQGAIALQNLFRSPSGDVTNIELGACGDPFAQGLTDRGIVVGSCRMAGASFGFLWKKRQ